MSDLAAPPASGHDPELCARAWLVLRTAYDRVADCLSDALARECVLSVTEFEVLMHLGQHRPEPQRIGSLVPAAALSQPALSRLVVRLEQRGLLERSRPGDDQRAVLVRLTAAGDDLLRRAMPLPGACVSAHLFNQTNAEEQAALMAILARIT